MDLKVGDVVVYSCQGVCRLERVLEREVGGKKLPYYLLSHLKNQYLNRF